MWALSEKKSCSLLLTREDDAYLESGSGRVPCEFAIGLFLILLQKKGFWCYVQGSSIQSSLPITHPQLPHYIMQIFTQNHSFTTRVNRSPCWKKSEQKSLTSRAGSNCRIWLNVCKWRFLIFCSIFLRYSATGLSQSQRKKTKGSPTSLYVCMCSPTWGHICTVLSLIIARCVQ